jgi:hypothetical protein
MLARLPFMPTLTFTLIRVTQLGSGNVTPTGEAVKNGDYTPYVPVNPAPLYLTGLKFPNVVMKPPCTMDLVQARLTVPGADTGRYAVQMASQMHPTYHFKAIVTSC